MMNLADLLSDIVSEDTLRRVKQVDISGVVLDSRRVCPGYCFIALEGHMQDGHDFISDAQSRGAVAVLAERAPTDNQATLPVVIIPKLASYLSALAARFYQYPSSALSLIGVTGTNGKTSTTVILAQVLNYLNKPCGVIGTLGAGIWPHMEITGLTTPDAVTVQRFLSQCLIHQVDTVAMEVSSHALSQGRVKACEIHTGIFTNLTPEHLDYHADLEDYFNAKKRLFTDYALQHAVVNIDDPYGKRLVNETNQAASYTTTIGTDDAADYQLLGCEASPKGIQATIKSPQGELCLSLPLIGEFQVMNSLGILASLVQLGYAADKVCQALSHIVGVPGRMQLLPASAPTIIIDYAHTPDALQHALKTLRAISNHKIWCVFGCGGDRDKSKRALMGKVAAQLADISVITSDNPRSEDPDAIMDDILAGMGNRQAVKRISDREAAIAYAIGAANKQDVVLIAGKGHETYQIVGQNTYPFDDRLVAKKYLA